MKPRWTKRSPTALFTLYPGLNAVRLVGTDLVQAVPLLLAASGVALLGKASLPPLVYELENDQWHKKRDDL